MAANLRSTRASLIQPIPREEPSQRVLSNAGSCESIDLEPHRCDAGTNDRFSPALIVARSWRQWPAQSSAFTDRRAIGGKALTAELRALAWVGGSHERPCCAFDRRRNL